jgi:hypothetical protein
MTRKLFTRIDHARRLCVLAPVELAVLATNHASLFDADTCAAITDLSVGETSAAFMDLVTEAMEWGHERLASDEDPDQHALIEELVGV